jgi:AcrR family transcriptional regulator
MPLSTAFHDNHVVDCYAGEAQLSCRPMPSKQPSKMHNPNAKRAAATEATPAAKRRRAYLPASERRRRIICAAQEVFSRTSLQGARTRELAKAAQINQATLFEHFESKEHLFAAAVVQPLLEVMQGMRDRAQALGEAASLEQMLALGQASSRRHLESIVQIYPLLATALFSDPTLGKKLYCEQIVPLLKARGEVMRGVVKDGVDPELLALAAFGMFFAVAMDRAFRGKKDNLSTIAEQLTDMVAFGFVKERVRTRATGGK